MNLKQLIKKLENKSPVAFAWSMLWRMWAIMTLGYIGIALFVIIIMIIAQ